MHLCEITLKRDQTPEGQKSPDLLNRKIEVPDLKTSVRLRISSTGIKVLEEAGGITKFLEAREEKKLLPKLIKLKQKLIEAGKIIVKKEEAEKAEEAPAKEAKAEEAPPEEKPAEAAPEAK